MTLHIRRYFFIPSGKFSVSSRYINFCFVILTVYQFGVIWSARESQHSVYTENISNYQRIQLPSCRLGQIAAFSPSSFWHDHFCKGYSFTGIRIIITEWAVPSTVFSQPPTANRKSRQHNTARFICCIYKHRGEQRVRRFVRHRAAATLTRRGPPSLSQRRRRRCELAASVVASRPDLPPPRPRRSPVTRELPVTRAWLEHLCNSFTEWLMYKNIFTVLFTEDVRLE